MNICIYVSTMSASNIYLLSTYIKFILNLYKNKFI